MHSQLFKQTPEYDVSQPFKEPFNRREISEIENAAVQWENPFGRIKIHGQVFQSSERISRQDKLDFFVASIKNSFSNIPKQKLFGTHGGNFVLPLPFQWRTGASFPGIISESANKYNSMRVNVSFCRGLWIMYEAWTAPRRPKIPGTTHASDLNARKRRPRV